MSGIELAAWSFPVLLLLIFIRIPIGLAMLLCGLGGAWVIYGSADPILNQLKQVTYSTFSNYNLSVIPLFLLMGQFAALGGLSQALFKAAEAWIGHRKGGVAMAAVGACAGFGAICGSSLATAATMGQVALPELKRAGYAGGISTAALAAGGTLGILIPPSGPMVLYGVISDTSIGQLFMAGLVPGLMLAAIFALWCMAVAWRTGQGRREPRASIGEIWEALRRSIWALALPPFILGGMYAGIFTATEAAGVGAMAALIIAVLVYRNLGWRDVWHSALDAARTSSMLFLILAAAAIFGHALTKLRIPNEIVELVAHYGLSQTGFLIAVMVLILVLGMFLETISIILITTPVILPVLIALKIDPVWYGILLTVNLELALITPPVGMNLFTLKAVSHAPIGEIIRGVAPYFMLLVFGLALIMIFPQLALFLPGTMF